MKVRLIQYDILWADPERNRQRLERIMRSVGGAAHADLYVLPEMFTTGFVTAPAPAADTLAASRPALSGTSTPAAVEADPAPTLDWMKSMALELDAAIAGSIAMRDGRTLRNRFYFVMPDGSVSFYDKHHLFTPGGEALCYTPGDERVSVEWRGMRFRLITCYDLRFPLWCRNDDGYDALICVASWPSPRQEAFDALLRARAIENQCYVLGVNRVGVDPSCQYSGGTAVIDPYGRTLTDQPVPFTDAGVSDTYRASSHSDTVDSALEGIVAASLDIEALRAFRAKFPVLADADAFSLKTSENDLQNKN